MANSFQLIRTNPRLSGNFKITVDSQGQVWLNTINANQTLAANQYKKFRVGSGSYETDLRRFMSSIPPDVLFDVNVITDPLTVPREFHDQYEFFYSCGASLIDNNFYTEPYSYFAPLWLEDTIPNYFVIVRAEDPLDYPYNVGVSNIVTGSTYKVVADTPGDTSFVVTYAGNTYTDGQRFNGSFTTTFTTAGLGRVVLLDENKDYPINNAQQFTHMLKQSAVVQTIDLSANTVIGKYIRGICNNSAFPTSPLTARFDSNLMTTWNGIAYQDGVWASKGELLDTYWQQGQSVIDFDDYITGGFQRQGIICANLLNMEFLFDDPLIPNYSIPRYYGFYCDSVEVGSFQLDGQKAFELRGLDGNTPVPTKAAQGFRNMGQDWYQNNPDGVRLYYEGKKGITPTTPEVSDIAVPGMWQPRMWCIQNKDGEFISLQTDFQKNGEVYKPWVYGVTNDDLVVMDKSVNLGRLAGAGSVAFQSPGQLTNNAGCSYLVMGLTASMFPNDEVKIYWTGGQKNDWLGNYDSVIANDLTGLEPGWGPGSYITDQYGNTYFHPYGTVEQVLSAIAGGFNSIEWAGYNAIMVYNFPAFDPLLKYAEGDTITYLDNAYVAEFANGPGAFNNANWKPIGPLELVFRFQNPAAANNQSFAYFILDVPDIVTVYETPLNSATVYDKHQFEGGTDLSKTRLIFPIDNTDELKSAEAWLKTQLGLSLVTFVGRYVDDISLAADGITYVINDFHTYGALVIEDNGDQIIIGSTGDFMVYRLYNVPVCLLSIYPIKEMDGDFLSSTYTQSPALEYKRYLDLSPGVDNLVTGRNYLVFADSLTSPPAAITYNGNIIYGTPNGTVFTCVPGASSYTIDTGEPFVAPEIFYQQSVPPEADLLLSGQNYVVYGDLAGTDIIQIDNIPSGSQQYVGTPGGKPIDSPIPSSGVTVLRYTVISGTPVVTLVTPTLDRDIASFNGFWTLHDFVTVGQETSINSSLPSFIHSGRFSQNQIQTEYDYLKENYTKERAVESRTFPDITKWAYKGGTDIRDNPYRLNTNQVFGQLNFSPSFDVKTQTPAGFTHEWYYLEQGPAEPDPSLYNYYWFGTPLDLTQLTDADPSAVDYFQQYFTVQPAPHTPVQDRYVSASYNEETGLVECFFRGVKVQFYEARVNTLTPAVQGVLPPTIANSLRFDDYRFTVILRAVPEDQCNPQPPVSMTFKENRTTKTLTLVIDLVINDYRTFELLPPNQVGDTIPPYLCPDIYVTQPSSGSGGYTSPVGSPWGWYYPVGSPWPIPDSPGWLHPYWGPDAPWWHGSSPGANWSGGNQSLLFWNNYPSNYPVRNLDYLTLYSMADKKLEALYDEMSLSPSGLIATGSSIIADVKLSQSLDFTSPSGQFGAFKNVFVYPEPNYPLDLRNEVHLIGKCNTIYGYYKYGYTFLPAPLSVSQNYLTFGMPGSNTYPLYINPQDGSYFPYETMRELTTGGFSFLFSPPSGSDFDWTGFPSWMRYGGSSYWTAVAGNLSFASISQAINGYTADVKWETYTWDSTTSSTILTEDEYYVQLVKPSTIFKTSALVPQTDNDIPSELINDTIIGVDLISVPVVSEMERYTGPYEPKFVDVVGFLNQKTDSLIDMFPAPGSPGSPYFGSPIYGSPIYASPYYLRPEYWRDSPNEPRADATYESFDLSFKNATFDINAANFGQAINHGYLKVAQTNIMDLANDPSYKSVYPLVQECPVDYLNLNLFQSNWDPGFWRQFVTKSAYSPVAGTREMTEVKNYFGTKIMRVPSQIQLETFTSQQVSGPSVNIQSVPSELIWYIGTDSKIYVTVNLFARLTRFFIEDGADYAFQAFTMPDFGVGNPNDPLADVTAYLQINVVPAFSVNLSSIYINAYSNTSQNLPILQTTLTDAQKLQARYVIQKNLTTQNLGNLIYSFSVTPIAGVNQSIAPSFTVVQI